jgi:hypothetical protein
MLRSSLKFKLVMIHFCNHHFHFPIDFVFFFLQLFVFLGKMIQPAQRESIQWRSSEYRSLRRTFLTSQVSDDASVSHSKRDHPTCSAHPLSLSATSHSVIFNREMNHIGSLEQICWKREIKTSSLVCTNRKSLPICSLLSLFVLTHYFSLFFLFPFPFFFVVELYTDVNTKHRILLVIVPNFHRHLEDLMKADGNLVLRRLPLESKTLHIPFLLLVLFRIRRQAL